MNQALAPRTHDAADVEKFAQLVATHGNYSMAYRETFAVSSSTKPMTVWRAAIAYANRPDIATRIRQLQREAADGVLMTVRELVRDWVDIATADPNELVCHVVTCCRNCHGIGFEYQWRDMAEWIDASTKNAESFPPKNPPEMSGGFGFDGQREPNDACPHCYGRGIGATIIADTTKLTGKARKLYKGVRHKANGDIEVLMHDQEAARQALGRAMGILNNDPLPLEAPKADGRTIEQGITPVAAANAYLQMVK
jgi:hypothetical protein